MAREGEVIAGRYRILKPLARGGMSQVYLALDDSLNKTWAVKEIVRDPADSASRIACDAALAEAQLMKSLDHHGIPRILDIVQTDERIDIVMDYVPGEPLSEVIRRDEARCEEEVIRWGIELCGILRYLHSRNPPVIYRDMKPANVMLLPDGSVRLIDFGIARRRGAEGSCEPALGTRGYAAPEQRSGRWDERSDIYGLGATLFALVTGQNPANRSGIGPIRQWNPALSGGLENILLKCTREDPGERYQTALDLEIALEHYREADDAWILGIRRRLHRFMIALGLALALFGAAGICSLRAATEREHHFENLLAEASVESGSEEQAAGYLRAIRARPSDLRGYEGLLEAYRADGRFTTDEEADLVAAMSGNLADLRREPGYGTWAYELGQLYWYCCDSKEEGSGEAGIRAATAWFEEAGKSGTGSSRKDRLARVYAGIGSFQQDVTLAVREAADRGQYVKYFHNLEKLMDAADDEEASQSLPDSELVRLEVCRLILNAEETYAPKFAEDGIAVSQQKKLLRRVARELDTIHVTGERTAELKKEILARVPQTEEAVKQAAEAHKTEDISDTQAAEVHKTGDISDTQEVTD